MPRMENTDRPGQTAVADYCTETGDGNSTYDMCQRCAKQWEGRPNTIGCDNGDPAGIVANEDCEHPPYDETGYTCAICERPLTNRDDGNAAS